ncbi:hypothetical protein N7486_007022 [Penicillium sp. IBT 16267x]|nr:hypothetical protein N7486_007022 [Penicillium sp. IBT 16267x]
MVIWAHGLPWFPVFKEVYVLAASWSTAIGYLLQTSVPRNGKKNRRWCPRQFARQAFSMDLPLPDRASIGITIGGSSFLSSTSLASATVTPLSSPIERPLPGTNEACHHSLLSIGALLGLYYLKRRADAKKNAKAAVDADAATVGLIHKMSNEEANVLIEKKGQFESSDTILGDAPDARCTTRRIDSFWKRV